MPRQDAGDLPLSPVLDREAFERDLIDSAEPEQRGRLIKLMEERKRLSGSKKVQIKDALGQSAGSDAQNENIREVRGATPPSRSYAPNERTRRKSIPELQVRFLMFFLALLMWEFAFGV